MKRPALYFSFRSPYSWLTIHRLGQAVPDAADALDWVPYWDPDERTERALKERQAEFHYHQMSRAKHRYLLMDTKRLAQSLGLSMAWPIDVDCWWERPHLAYMAARRQGRAREFYDAAIAARWGRGEDICAAEVLARVAVEAGVDPQTALAATEDAEVRAESVDCLVRAYEEDVFGIPYLKWGRHRFWGYDRLGAFLAAWRGPDAAPAEVPVRTGYDIDTAGGCG